MTGSTQSREGEFPLALPEQRSHTLNPLGEFQMINVRDFRMIIDKPEWFQRASLERSNFWGDELRSRPGGDRTSSVRCQVVPLLEEIIVRQGGVEILGAAVSS